VLPNLQRLLPSRPLSPTEVDMNGNNIYFYDDIATLRTEWQSQNVENVGELLIDFFRYFAKEFSYSRDVISLRTDTGTFPKDGVNWIGEVGTHIYIVLVHAAHNLPWLCSCASRILFRPVTMSLGLSPKTASTL